MSTYTPEGIRKALAIFTGTSGIASAVNLVTVIASVGATLNGLFTPAAGTRAYWVRGVAGGGGGGGVTNAGATSAGAGGGQGGGYFEFWVFANKKNLYQVGTRGAGGLAGANGGAGVDTLFGGSLNNPAATATGGGGGGSSSSVGPPNTRVSLVQSYLPSEGGEITVSPNPGDFGENIITTLSYAGKGGDTPFGQGGAGRTTDGVGNAAAGYGGGGGGALSIGAGGSKVGGVGGFGALVIVEFK